MESHGQPYRRLEIQQDSFSAQATPRPVARAYRGGTPIVPPLCAVQALKIVPSKVISIYYY